jgi:hypothetical protein
VIVCVIRSTVSPRKTGMLSREINVLFNAVHNPMRRRRLEVALLAGLLALLFSSTASAQFKGAEGRYHPLNQQTPPGTAGLWSAIMNPAAARYHQPVRVELPRGGQVTFFAGPERRAVAQPAPAVAGVAVGHVYRLRISDMPQYPGIDLFPTIEILDRLHPPAGKLFDFPVPVQITPDEIDLALQGNLVTKVIYLEQPQLADPRPQSDLVGATVVAANQNALVEADRRGRPMVILRMGGRVPSRQDGDARFFGSGAKITLPPKSAAQKPPAAAQRRNPSRRTRVSNLAPINRFIGR